MAARKSAVVPAVAEDNIFEIVPPKPEYGVSRSRRRAQVDSRRSWRLHALQAAQAGAQADRLWRGQSARGADVRGRRPGRRRRRAGRAVRWPRRPVAQQHDQGDGPAARRCLYRERGQVPSPGNRTPEPDECETCSPFLMRQIAAIKPKVVVALGATAAKNLLAMNSSLGELRGRFYDFKPAGVAAAIPLGRARASLSLITPHSCCAIRARRAKLGKTCRW